MVRGAPAMSVEAAAARVAEAGGAGADELDRVAHEEMLALGKVVCAYEAYEESTLREVFRWEWNLSKLSEEDKALVPNLPRRIERARGLVEHNARALAAITSAFDGAAETARCVDRSAVTHGDIEKVRCVMRSIARDWTQEGKAERDASYGPIIRELERVLPLSGANGGAHGASWGGAHEHAPPNAPPPRVLVPGAGLGRLAWEIARRGYESQGNEFSYYMLLASSYVLNGTDAAEPTSIYPWVHSTSNNVTDADAERPATFPDVSPSGEPGDPPLNMSMCAGDFVEVYTAEDMVGAWDAVCTCFFLDTAENVLQYLRTVYGCLRPGGYLINLGPLLFHWAEHGGEQLSLEMSLEDVLLAAERIGFELVRREAELLPCRYTGNAKSMLRTVYHCAMFTLRKPA